VARGWPPISSKDSSSRYIRARRRIRISGSSDVAVFPAGKGRVLKEGPLFEESLQ